MRIDFTYGLATYKSQVRPLNPDQKDNLRMPVEKWLEGGEGDNQALHQPVGHTMCSIQEEGSKDEVDDGPEGPFRTLKYIRKPFGLANASSAYSRILDMSMKKVYMEIWTSYLDEILMFSIMGSFWSPIQQF